MSGSILFGYGKQAASMQLNKLNRHGIIAGATGTGKTVTLKVLAEQLSDVGIPVFLSDIKGDLTSLAQANTKDVSERVAQTAREGYEAKAYPVQLWDVKGEQGTALRMTISEMGPVLLTRLLGLNETQESILNVVFDVASKQQLELVDLDDLRAMLNYVAAHASELGEHYGNIPARSVGAILRSLVVIEQQGGNVFFAEPSLEISDLMQTASDGRGVVNILNAEQLFAQPTLYATVLLAVLSKLYESLPEVGDLDKPKLVFFFDEAHALFKDAPAVLLEKIELIVRLVRSKGVGVYFVTQNPTDIPDKIASQLGNRIQHGLRAFTPKELKTVSTVAETFRQEAGEDLAKVIQELKVGEAVVSTLQADGTPSLADRVLIYPPQSDLGTIESSVKLALINQSPLESKYAERLERDSAKEKIERLVEQEEVEEEEEEEMATKKRKSSGTSERRSDSMFDRLAKNMMGQVGRELGKIVSKSISNLFKK